MDRRAVCVHAAISTIILLFTIIARVDFIGVLAHIDSIFRIMEDIPINYDEGIF